MLALLVSGCAVGSEQDPSAALDGAAASNVSRASTDPGATAAPYSCEALLEPPAEQPKSTEASPQPLGFTPFDEGAWHGEPSWTLTYDFCPPTSGAQLDITLDRGFYGPEREQHPGRWVHSLEHGYAAVLYSCADGCPSDEELSALRRFVEEAPPSPGAEECALPNKLIAARFDEMPARFALVAWRRAHLSDTFDRELALAFAEQWVDSSLTPEPEVC